MWRMKRKIYLYGLVVGLVAGGLLAGCAASGQPLAERRMTSGPYILTPDSTNRLQLDFVFHIPENYIKKRNRLIVTPQLCHGSEVKEEYLPVVLDAPVFRQKMLRKQVLEQETDPYEAYVRKPERGNQAFHLPYRQTVQLPEGVENGRIVAVVTTDGCGACTGLDTVEVASIQNLIPLTEDTWRLPVEKREFVVRPKVREGSGEARLQFAINQSDIDLSMGDNRQEMEGMLHTLQPIVEDTLAVLDAVTITGLASADGSSAYNTALARNRALSAKNWLAGELDLDAAGRQVFRVSSRPEGWQPVLLAMTAAGDKDSVAVKNILETYGDKDEDVHERYIRRLPCWNRIKKEYLQKDRKVAYIYTYTMKSFTTDAQLLALYESRPDAFNEEELLRVAALKRGGEEKMEVYRTILTYFPQSEAAASDYASILINEGRLKEAREVLTSLAKHSPLVTNMLAATHAYAHDYEKAAELLQNIDLPSAKYNLGLVKARQRKLHEAYALLKPFVDLNSAIIALSVNENNQAEKVLERLDDESCKAEYVRALLAARLHKRSEFYNHLEAACRDNRLRKRAVDEPDFVPYKKDSRFRMLVHRKY